MFGCRVLAESFRNGDMCRLTEQVIFTDPYYAAPVNSHNPEIDDLACALRSDQEAKIAASRLKVPPTISSQLHLHFLVALHHFISCALPLPPPWNLPRSARPFPILCRSTLPPLQAKQAFDPGSLPNSARAFPCSALLPFHHCNQCQAKQSVDTTATCCIALHFITTISVIKTTVACHSNTLHLPAGQVCGTSSGPAAW